MKPIVRVVSTSFWEDPKVTTLFTPEDKFFMLYLLTNPHTTQLGIYQLVPKIAAFEMGYSVEAVNSLLERFESKYGIIKYNSETMEVAIRNFLRHSVIKGGKPVMDCLLNEKNKVKDKSLLLFISESLKDDANLVVTVREFLETVKEESTKEENTLNDNDNDNDNERIVHESYHESSTNRIGIRGHDLQVATDNGFAQPEELMTAYVDFYKMRKSIKKPLSDRAVSMLKNKLDELSGGNVQKMIAILNQSSFHCWQGVYDLKDGNDIPSASDNNNATYDSYGNRRQ